MGTGSVGKWTHNGMPRWRFVYLALASFNLLTILLSITITHNLMTLHDSTLKTNAEWSGRVSAIHRLGELAQAVREPVTNIFASGDADAERARRDKALGLFQVALINIRRGLGAGAEMDDLLAALSRAEQGMDTMVVSGDAAIAGVATGRLNAVLPHVVALNAEHERLLKEISAALDAAHAVQAGFPEQQTAIARNLQVVEYTLGGLVLLLVVGAAVYGGRVGRMARLQTRDIELSRNAAEAANEAKSNFLASMSHEIRTPMNGILGMAQSLKTASLPPAENEKVSIILDSGTALLGVLNDVLDFSKIEAGKFDITPSANDILQTADRVVRLFETHAREKGVAIGLTHDDDLPRNLVCDAERVRQCVNNLVSNALKFTPSGRIDVHVSWRRASDTDALIFISVKDTGIGMAPDVQARLFKPFTQADTSIARRYGGTGLGLAISLRLAQLMGGGLAVESAPDAGSRFVLTFRAEVRDQPKPVAIATPEPARPALQGLRGCRVLLTDDNAINRQVVKLFLAPHGCQITEAVNGQEALDKLAAAAFDILLLDVHMPVMDGKETIKRIRASSEAWSALPVIALTADAMTGDREALIGIGMSDYLSKPIDQTALITRIRALLHITPPQEAAVA